MARSRSGISTTVIIVILGLLIATVAFFATFFLSPRAQIPPSQQQLRIPEIVAPSRAPLTPLIRPTPTPLPTPTPTPTPAGSANPSTQP